MSSSANVPRITYYVVMFRQPPDSGSAIRPLSRLLKEEEETVRQKMLTPAFEVLSRFARHDNAEGMQNQLHALGVDTIVVSDQDIRGHLIVWVDKGSHGAGGMAFRDFDGKPLYVPFDDIASIVVMEVPRADGTTATLIDLHRHSTSITPRLDVAYFDFPAILREPEAGLEEFLGELQQRAPMTVNREYIQHREDIVRAAQDFGSRPAEFAPPPADLAVPYAAGANLPASIWSFLIYTRENQKP